jgi:transcription antitermination factor NusG
MDLRQAFLNRESIASVEYQHNDYVRVIDGQYKGITGSLISLEAVAPEPTYLVELEEGGDVKVRQSQLCFISHD